MQAAGQNTEEDNETARLIAHEAERFADLTERELSVVRLVAQGMDNREIASTLFLSEGTVRNHISSILSKKGALQPHADRGALLPRLTGANRERPLAS